MIIVGTANIHVAKGAGTFHCPRCAASRPYRQRAVRRFLTLYFLPLIPLDVVAEYLECGACGRAFPVDLLQLDATGLAAEEERYFLQELQRVLVLVMLADGSADPAELEAVQEFLQESGGPRPEVEELAEQVRLAREAIAAREGDQGAAAALDYIAALAPRLSERRKKLLVCGAFAVASAGGQLHPSQQFLLSRLPRAVGISEAAFQQLIAQYTGEQAGRPE